MLLTDETKNRLFQSNHLECTSTRYHRCWLVKFLLSFRAILKVSVFIILQPFHIDLSLHFFTNSNSIFDTNTTSKLVRKLRSTSEIVNKRNSCRFNEITIVVRMRLCRNICDNEVLHLTMNIGKLDLDIKLWVFQNKKERCVFLPGSLFKSWLSYSACDDIHMYTE